MLIQDWQKDGHIWLFLTFCCWKIEPFPTVLCLSNILCLSNCLSLKPHMKMQKMFHCSLGNWISEFNVLRFKDPAWRILIELIVPVLKLICSWVHRSKYHDFIHNTGKHFNRPWAKLFPFKKTCARTTTDHTVPIPRTERQILHGRVRKYLRTSAACSKHQGCPRPAGAGPPAAPASHFAFTACQRQSLTEERSSGSRRAPWRSWSRGWRCFELEKGAVSY